LGVAPANWGNTQLPRAAANLVSGQQLTEVGSVTGRPTGLLNYQGQLLQDGSPVNGAVAITFTLYYTDTGGYAWWQEMQTVDVEDGLFNVMLGAVNPLDDSAVSFQSQMWLEVQPAGAAAPLTPRQPLGVVGYAMNLMPGATLVDQNVGGPYWTTFYVTSEDHPAIYGGSDADAGVRGESYYDGAAGVEGNAYGFGGSGTSGRNFGDDGHGTAGWNYGDSTACPVGDTECAAGIYGAAYGDSYASFFYGQNRSAVIGVITGTYYTVWGYTGAGPDGYGFSTNGESYFNDYVIFGGGKSGYVVDIALNDGDAPLEKGDVVVISGYDAPVVGNIPVVRVRKAAEANATGIIGVVDVLYVPCDKPQESLQAGEGCGGFKSSVTVVQPGEYLSVVALGAYEAIKVDATSGPIRPGDLLATSASTGYATKAPLLTVGGVSFNAPGTIVGKALGALNEGVGIIPVFVSAR
jgi:hypothetical protein